MTGTIGWRKTLPLRSSTAERDRSTIRANGRLIAVAMFSLRRGRRRHPRPFRRAATQHALTKIRR